MTITQTECCYNVFGRIAERFRNPTDTITISGFECYVTTSCVYACRYLYDANRFHD